MRGAVALCIAMLAACTDTPTSPWLEPLDSDGPCSSDINCPADQICQSGTCVEGTCSKDADCGADEACDHGRCRPIDAQDCTALGCPPGQTCHPGLRRCVSPVEEGCTSDGDCPYGESCDEPSGRCSPAIGNTCREDADCSLSSRCVAIEGAARRCVEQTCRRDDDCAVRGGRCDRRTSRCVPVSGQPCEVDRDCPEIAGKMGWCDRQSRRCRSTDAESFCLDDWACEEGQRCDRENSTCVPINSCTEDLQCPPRQRCAQRRCHVTARGDACDHDSVCPVGSRCDLGRCN